jgi:hypothetical protein
VREIKTERIGVAAEGGNVFQLFLTLKVLVERLEGQEDVLFVEKSA